MSGLEVVAAMLIAAVAGSAVGLVPPAMIGFVGAAVVRGWRIRRA